VNNNNTRLPVPTLHPFVDRNKHTITSGLTSYST